MPERVRKPEWLKISIGANERYTETKRIVESHCLHTICSSGRCPNMGNVGERHRNLHDWEISAPGAVSSATRQAGSPCRWMPMSLHMWQSPLP